MQDVYRRSVETEQNKKGERPSLVLYCAITLSIVYKYLEFGK